MLLCLLTRFCPFLIFGSYS
uniref:Uncharacterized protein n=1 Tax=Rhizophora mucronata TaxID=61149 RepID=A0A2P2QK13_RHIMU